MSNNSNDNYPFSREEAGRLSAALLLLVLIWGAIFLICKLGMDRWQRIEEAHCDIRPAPPQEGVEAQSLPDRSHPMVAKDGIDYTWQGAVVVVMLPLFGLAAGTACTVGLLRRDS